MPHERRGDPGLEAQPLGSALDWAVAYLGLGSNLACRDQNLQAAMERLADAQEKSLQILRTSSVYETAAWGLEDQPPFLNSVVQVGTRLPPSALLAWAKTVESDLGREPGARFGPRLIDIDILLYNEEIVDQPDLQIPHPRLHLRAFALVPLAEVAEALVHPMLQRSIAELAKEVEGRDGVKFWSPPQKFR